jgi:hypothetical protein
MFTGGHEHLPVELSNCFLDAGIISGHHQPLKGGSLGGALVNVLNHWLVMDQDKWLAGESF